ITSDAANLVNAGTIRKTGGMATSDLSIQGKIINTGAIEADSGTLFLDAQGLAQLAGTALTGGAWNALNGATLQFPTGSSIATNAANIALGGAGATLTALARLMSNSGSLSVTGGATFTTAGDLTNSGNLTVGGPFHVTGNYTQSTGAALNVQL